MITGFSLAPWSQIPPPLCGPSVATAFDQCACFPRFRGSLSHKIPRNGTILASSVSNIKSVKCQNENLVSWGGEHPTSADVQVRLFVSNGNAYIHIIDGRVGRIITLTLNVIQNDGAVSSHILTLEITQ